MKYIYQYLSNQTVLYDNTYFHENPQFVTAKQKHKNKYMTYLLINSFLS